MRASHSVHYPDFVGAVMNSKRQSEKNASAQRLTNVNVTTADEG
jgi:hypothetical protein